MDRTKDTKAFLSRLLDFPSKSWFDFYIKHFKKIISIVIAILLGIVLMLGWMSAKKVREVVVEDFNQQQLVLARHSASQIENSLNLLRRELTLLSLSPSVQYAEEVFMSKRIGIAFSSIKEAGGLEIRFVENKRTHVVDDHGYQTMNPFPEDENHLEWARQEENKGNILISDVFPIPPHPTTIMKMILPVRQVSVDESHPIATNKFSGVLIFVVDVTRLIEKITKGIGSGKTGYSWAIDKNGIFLYHPEMEFVGKNAFEARKERKPAISFARINEIQRKKMIKGEDGVSWYISGWHRGKEEEMKKLIAYSPIRLNGRNENHIWSVAVVAPISEVEGVIHDIQFRQFMLEGVVILAIFSGGLLLIGIMLRWSSSLNEEVKKKTGELKKSENLYRSLIEHANDIIFTVNRNGEIISVNQAGRSFFKKTGEEILGRNIGEICFNEDSASIQFTAIDEVFKTQMSKQITYPVTINGNEYWLSTNFSGLLDEKGEVFAVLGIARDFTERKKIEGQMYHTEKLASLGTLSAGVAHEINNPLAIILGFTDMLAEKVLPDSEFYEILKTIEKQGMNAKRVVENLLTFARFTEYKEEDVNINKNIEEVLVVVGNTLSLNKIAINRELSESLPTVKGDLRELQQVFLNIINNAISAMKGGGILTIVTRMIDEGQNVEIRISDTGCGIKKEHRTRIFDPLFTTKKMGEGTGLGLSVSYGIITKHGGNITFKTKTGEESGETGTTFIITLPAIKQQIVNSE